MKKIKVLHPFNHDELGALAAGDEREVTAAQAASLAFFPFVEFVGKLETKPERAAKIETKPEPHGKTKHKAR